MVFDAMAYFGNGICLRLRFKRREQGPETIGGAIATEDIVTLVLDDCCIFGEMCGTAMIA